MAEVHFYLKDLQSPTLIYCILHCKDGKMKKSTGLKIKPDDWDVLAEAPELPLPQNKDPHRAVRAQLGRIKQALIDMQTDYLLKGEYLLREVAGKRVDELAGRTISRAKKSMYDDVDAIIKGMRAGLILTDKGTRYEESTVKRYEQAKGMLKQFRPSLTWQATSLQTYEQFVAWCNEKNYSRNFTGQLIKCWKRLIKIARHEGYHNNLIDRDERFLRLTEQTPDVALSEEEIKALYKLNLRDNKRYDKVRDWFVLGCYVGLRVSDLIRLGDMNLVNDTILIHNKKTGEIVTLPLHPIVKKIIKKHGGFPPKSSDVEINRIIKKVAEEAGLKETFIYTVTKGGRKTQEYLLKWQMISCHTARRTLITNLRKAGMPTSIVMKLTGIKDEKTINRYDKLTPQQAAEVAARHKFFKG